jgi:predicted nucleotidyltransferase
MPITRSPLAPTDLTRYRATAHAREAERQAALSAHRARALATAHEAASELRRSFVARRVVLFGSLARGGPVSWHSDVDLAAWDVPADRYFVAVGRLQAVDSAISVDLVRAEDAPPALLAVIDAEGIEL